MPKDDDSFPCPNCGADVPSRAFACPECGSDARTGWSDDTIYDGIDLPDPDEFDHEEWLRREQGAQQDRGPRGRWAVAVGWILFALLLYLVMRG